ncbi:hypothetical protein [Alteromonas sp. a30]|uniref:hypothetical protein n=1 Tax=Alteromonas sp. a30 TaxID=2730917 RepID=UPI00227FA1D7|nr:hypothetical protein [Alteromonas sp. a30]
MDSLEIELLKKDIAPYLSILLAIKNSGCGSHDFHEIIVQIIKEECSGDFSVKDTFRDSVDDIGGIKITLYKVERKPSWTNNSQLKDIENHVVISFDIGEYQAFYFSEKGKKDLIRSFFGNGKLVDLLPVPISILNACFINEDEVRMLWLSGINGRDNFKADSKVLGGKSVADTLDPLLDQSYMMSAVRTATGSGGKSSIGINPFKSSIWRGPCNDWNVFESRVIEILDTLSSNSAKSDTPISILSYPISSVDEVSTPYDFTLVDYEFLPEEDGQHRKDLLNNLQHDFFVELTDSFSEKDIALNIFHKGKKVGSICVELDVVEYKVSFKIKNEVFINKTHCEKYKKVFKYPELIRCWFESGHSVINGMVFQTGYRDVEFNRFLWAGFEDFDVSKEKPGIDPRKPDLKKIGKEKSLFCWIQSRWSGSWLTSDEFKTTEKQKGWLYCDDGAGEKADFIHYEKYKQFHIISLIHVKAAKTSRPERKISVGAHDIVLNQAVKNLRYTNRKTLLEDLQSRHSEVVHKGCWHNGKEAEPEKFFSELSSLKDNRYVKYRVIVIQPHTQKEVYEKSGGTKIKTQLDVLLVSAENDIRSSGAEFYIVGFAGK